MVSPTSYTEATPANMLVITYDMSFFKSHKNHEYLILLQTACASDLEMFFQ